MDGSRDQITGGSDETANMLGAGDQNQDSGGSIVFYGSDLSGDTVTGAGDTTGTSSGGFSETGDGYSGYAPPEDVQPPLEDTPPPSGASAVVSVTVTTAAATSPRPLEFARRSPGRAGPGAVNLGHIGPTPLGVVSLTSEAHAGTAFAIMPSLR